MKLLFLFFTLLISVCACAPAPHIAYYTIHLGEHTAQMATKKDTIFIEPFAVTQEYAQDRLVYQDSPYKVSFDHYRRWIAPPAELLRIRLSEFLKYDCKYPNVTTHFPKQDQFVIISCSIRLFRERIKPDGRFAQVAVWIELRESQNRHPVWAGLLQHEQQITKPSAEAIVEAMSLATAAVFKQISERLSYFLE